MVITKSKQAYRHIATEQTQSGSPPAITPVSIARSSIAPVSPSKIATPARRQPLLWAGARLGFYAYIIFALATLLGGFLTAPLMTYCFFTDWRFWRYWKRGFRLFTHGWRIIWLILRGEGRYMTSVRLTSPPQGVPDHRRVTLSPAWKHGVACGRCRRCCQINGKTCPVLDTDTGLCSGYNSFYWRYFNCGRYPAREVEIQYYGCEKWQMKDLR